MTNKQGTDLVAPESESQEDIQEKQTENQESDAVDESEEIQQGEGDSDESKPMSPDEDLIKEDDPKGVKKRIDKLVARNKTLQDQINEIQSKQVRSQIEASKEIDPETGQYLIKPVRSDYADPYDYADALENYREKKERAKMQMLEYQKQWDTGKSMLEKFEQKKEQARKKYDDFDEVEMIATRNDFPISQPMLDVILQSDHGADLFYWLGKHPDQARSLYSMNPYQAAKEMGKLEYEFDKPKKLPSQAPKPIPTEKSGKTVQTNPENMPLDDFTKWLGLS